MKDIFAFVKLLILVSLAASLKVEDFNSTNYTCRDLLESNEVKNLSENFNLEIEEEFVKSNNNFSDFNNFISNYQSIGRNDELEDLENSFSFTEGKLSCRITIKHADNHSKILKRNLVQTACDKNSQCFETTFVSDAASCVDRFENGIEKYATLDNGGTCIPNTCTTATGTTIAMNKIIELDTTVSNFATPGECKCSSANKCFDSENRMCISGKKSKVNEDQKECLSVCSGGKCADEDFNCIIIPANFYRDNDGDCISNTCKLDPAIITKNPNSFDVNLSVASGNAKIEFTDTTNNVLAGVNQDGAKNRYIYQIYLTDEFGNYKVGSTSLTYKTTTPSITLPFSITMTSAEITEFCDQIDLSGSNGEKINKCYILAVVLDTCTYLKDLAVYTHLAERYFSIVGDTIYAISPDLDVTETKDLSIDYCSYVDAECTLSTEYKYTAELCDDLTCANPYTTQVYKRGDTVYVRVTFTDNSNVAVTGKDWDLLSVRTKQFSKTSTALDTIDLGEELIDNVTNESTLANVLKFQFILKSDFLFYDDETLMSKVLKLFMLIKVNPHLRMLEVKVEPTVIIPQSGGLLIIGVDEQDYKEYKTIIIMNKETDSNNKKVIIAVVCSVVGFLLICIALLLYFCCLKKQNKDKKVIPVDQMSENEKYQTNTLRIQVKDDAKSDL